MYIFAGGGRGELSDIQVTSCPDKNAGARDVRLYHYVNYRNRNINPVSGHFVVGVGVEKMSSSHGSFLFPSVSLSPSGGEGGNCRPYELRND